MIARAIAARCISPPESCAGRWARRCDRPTRSASRAASSMASRRIAAEQPRQRDVLLHGERRQQVEELKDEADAIAAKAGERALVQRGDVGSLDGDAAARRHDPWRRRDGAASICRSPTAPSARRARRARGSATRHGARPPARRCRRRFSRDRERRARDRTGARATDGTGYRLQATGYRLQATGTGLKSAA